MGHTPGQSIWFPRLQKNVKLKGISHIINCHLTLAPPGIYQTNIKVKDLITFHSIYNRVIIEFFSICFFESLKWLKNTSHKCSSSNALGSASYTLFCYSARVWLRSLLRLQIPRTTNAAPITRIRMSAQNSRAQTEFTVPAMINNNAKNIRAIPVTVSPFILFIGLNLELD